MLYVSLVLVVLTTICVNQIDVQAQGLPSSTAAETVKSATAYTVNGVINLFKAASTQRTIQRVVLTSSIVAAGYPTGKGFKLDAGKATVNR